MTAKLTKSTYMSGLQCGKRLYLERKQPQLRPPRTQAEEELLRSGSEVGAVARTRYPGGTTIPGGGEAAALAATKRALADAKVPALFEAAFLHRDVLVRVDILERVPGAGSRGDGWRLIEVKSSTEVKDEHLDDLAVQVHVARKAGLKVVDAGVMVLNREYVRGPGGLDPARLFRFESMLPEAGGKSAAVARDIGRFLRVLARKTEPAIAPGDQCYSPRDCPFQGYCIGTRSPYSPLNLPGGKKLAAKLEELGIKDVRRQRAAARERMLAGALTARQVIAREALLADREYVGRDLAKKLQAVEWPLLFIDFEAVAPAVPRYAGTGVYEALPFQWSCHIQERAGAPLKHREFLHDADTDPRKAFLKSLLACAGRTGTVVVYSAYEKTRLNALATAFPPEARKIAALTGRLLDLLAIVRSSYYHPLFRDSYSIKAVLPVVTKVSYKKLAIQNGAVAAADYVRMIEHARTNPERARLRKSLLEYCKMDTFAMVEVRRSLLKRAGVG